MPTKPMQAFFFGQLADEGIRAILKGRFLHSQLYACEYDGITWKRHGGESAEQFEKRVTQDIREMLASESI
jgi:hypothetical protein